MLLRKQAAFFALLLLIFVLTPHEAFAQSLPRVTWKTDYFNSVNLSGNVARSTTVTQALSQGIGRGFDDTFLRTKTSHFDQFSVRNTTTVSLDVETYYMITLETVWAENEARILIDGQQVLTTGKYGEIAVDKLLSAGSHTIIVEYQHYVGDRYYRAGIKELPNKESSQIDTFSLTPTVLSAETTQVTVNWSASGLTSADRIQIEGPNNTMLYNVAANGSTKITFRAPSLVQGTPYYSSLAAGVRFRILRQSSALTYYLPFECTAQSWFFANAPMRCPLQPPQALDMEIQYFENGAAIWNKSSNHVHAFYGAEGQRRSRIIEWSDSDATDSNEGMTAPAGKFKPLNAFGKIWSTPDVRSGLGWAISAPIAYSGFMQCAVTGCYFATPSNQVYFDTNNGQFAWELITRTVTARRGTVTPPVPPTTGGGSCVIPTSGPWPACATNGGGTTNPPTSGGGCVIPPSGPWPTCATNGGGTTNPPTSGGGCVIPTSGPWPACATNGGGTTNPPTSGGGCVIPPSGPWPACATSGGGTTPGSGGGSCVIPKVGPWPACAR